MPRHRSTPTRSWRPPPWSRRALPWAAFALAIVATGILIERRGEDLAVLRSLAAPAVVLLVLLQVVYLGVQSGRFHVVLVRLADRPVGFWGWLQLFVLGRFLNLFLPQAGNVYRALELKRRFGVGYTRFGAAFVNAPWLAMVLNFVLGAAVVAIAQGDARVAGWPLSLLLALAAVVTAAAPLVAVALLPLLPRRVRAVAWLHGRLEEMVCVTLDSLRDAAYLARVTVWTVVAFVQASAMLYLGFVALGAEVTVADAVAFYVLLQLATYVAVTPGNLGLQELAFGVLAVGLGSAAVDGVVVSALVRVTGVVALVALALPLGGVQALRAGREATGAGGTGATAAGSGGQVAGVPGAPGPMPPR